jgi:hypothetical protein
MRRNKACKRGQMVSIVAACGIGYLIGGWHTAALRSTELSVAESVMLRFPEAWNNASLVSSSHDASPAATATTSTADHAQLALLSPEPMFPQVIPRASPPAVPQTAVRTAAAEVIGSSPTPDASESLQASPPVAARAASETKTAAVAARRHPINRPGYMLNDAQIASIKERLHLKPDQESMWPAVEAALRNIAYARAQEARGHGGPATSTQVAAIDPNAVQGLKSAAVPLIMSFNTEQKEEVRNLAHVMGLDPLASQF